MSSGDHPHRNVKNITYKQVGSIFKPRTILYKERSLQWRLLFVIIIIIIIIIILSWLLNNTVNIETSVSDMTINECGAVRGMRIGRGNRRIRREPAQMSLCPPQIPHDLTCNRTRAAAVRSQRLTTWAMVLPVACWRILLHCRYKLTGLLRKEC
jgi:hypothetical protein